MSPNAYQLLKEKTGLVHFLIEYQCSQVSLESDIHYIAVLDLLKMP
jgi:hypothetical protein